MKKARWAATALALFSALQVAACDSPTEPKVPNNPKKVQIQSVSSLEVGRAATVRGRGLSEITELTIDGQPVNFSLRSDEELEFTVPKLRACETDGRKVEIRANHGEARAVGGMHVQNALRLEVAESRVLSAEDLSCVQIAAGAEEYVLTLANLSRNPEAGPSAIVHGQGTADAVAANLGAPATAAAMRLSSDVAAELAPDVPPFQVGQELFDDYVNARLGDTLRFVDWDDYRVVRQAKTKEEVPYYEARVIAATAQHVVVVDLRDPKAASAISRSHTFQQAAEIADKYLLSAIQATIDPQATLPRERIISILRTLPPGYAGTTSSPEYMSQYQWSSGIYAIQLDIEHSQEAEIIAGTMIHETAHMVDLSYNARGKASTVSWLGEAFAVNAEDYAARLARGGTTNVVAPSPDSPPAPHTPYMRLPTSASRSPTYSSPYMMWETRGAYDRGARILRYAGEKAGGVAEVYQRLSAAAPAWDAPYEVRADAWSIDRLAEVVGMTAERLLTESMLAELTDDLVPAEAATKHGLPQLEGWRHINEPLEMRTGGSLSRAATVTRTVQVVGGGYMAWMIPGAGGQGISLVSKEIPEQHEVRLTRVR